MEKISQKDLILLPFPFSDNSGSKIRPALILSNKEYNLSKDIIVCGITSNLRNNNFSINLDNDCLESGILYEKSLIKPGTILKIKKELVIAKIGKIKINIFKKVISKLNQILKEN